jgi:glycosyltransferase involved in cell wall biosynthesis
MAIKQPLVTALINTYNYGRYLPFAINSVLNQTYSNLEIIVVDDGSTDHTKEVLRQYGDRIKSIRTTNGGQGHAFNVGIPEAQGELVMLLDADDSWLPEKVERMVEFAASRPNAGMLYHRFQNVNPNGYYLGPPQPFPLINGNYRRKYLRSGGTWWSPITSVLVFRTDHIKKVVPIPTYAHREGADTILTDYCAMTTEIASHPESFALRLLHGSNLYAAGRDNTYYRPKAIRESDVRRIEWRMASMKAVMKRFEPEIKLKVERNEWRTTNLYWLGRASLWEVLRACLLSPEHSISARLERLKWVFASYKMYREAD